MMRSMNHLNQIERGTPNVLPDRRIRFAHTLGLLALMIVAGSALLLEPLHAFARPVMRLQFDRKDANQAAFVESLEKAWVRGQYPYDAALAGSEGSEGYIRVRAVARGRAHFALVSSALKKDIENEPGVTVISVLWPELLHALTWNPSLKEVRQPLAGEIWLFDSPHFPPGSLNVVGNNPRSATEPVSRTDWDLAHDALEAGAQAAGPLYLLTAPLGTREITVALHASAGLQLVPFQDRLVKNLSNNWNWVSSELVPANTYPRQPRAMELPASYVLLIGQAGLPPQAVGKMLDILLSTRSGLERLHPAFAQIDEKRNKGFLTRMPFHPTARARFE